jgi:CBS domain-containing protein
VDDEGRLLGMLTEGDLLHRTEIGTEARRRSWWLELFSSTQDLAATYIKENARLVRDVMTPEVITVKETTPVREIADLLERHRIKRVPVLYDGELLGIVSRANLVKALASVPKEAGVKLVAADQSIREAVLRELSAHRGAVPAENIIVNEGTVHLWGVVTSPEQARAMCIAAERVQGVRGRGRPYRCSGDDSHDVIVDEIRRREPTRSRSGVRRLRLARADASRRAEERL